MAILFDSGYGLFDSASGLFDDGGVISPTISVSGITLTAEAGSIAENVSDITQITGLESSITAENISATGIQNSNIVITGLELSLAFGSIGESVNEFIEINGQDLLINVEAISATGIQNQSIALSGIDLIAEYGSINEQVVDSIAILGIDLAITAQSISANGIANANIQLTGISLQSDTGLVSATGSEIIPEEYTGGRESRREINATAKVQSLRSIAYAGRPTPRGFTVINGGAKVISLQTNTEISEASALGQLGIDEESLLMLLVA